MEKGQQAFQATTSKDAASLEKATVTELVVDVRDADDARLAELGYKGEFKREFSVSTML